MKISEVTVDTVKEYCGIATAEDNIIAVLMPAAKAFIMGYTALSDEEIELHEDLSVAYMVIINEMYSNRDYSANKENINPCVRTILDLYSKNNVE